MINGTIVKGIGGFYYVKTEKGILECKARGLFRKDKILPMVGDRVCVEPKKNDATNIIKKIEERDNFLVRPPVANIDMAIIVFSITRPEPNLYLLDRFLTIIEQNDIHICICFNKVDIADENKKNDIISIYEKTGYPIICSSAKTGEGLKELKEILKDHTSIFSGPSGVGKSSLLNKMQSNLDLKTGEISSKSERGKHTTRHVELLELEFGGYVLDTPGFTSLEIKDVEEAELQYFFPEFIPHIDQCKFNGCRHMQEPKCAIKEKVLSKDISESRYDSYLSILKEIQEQRRY
ncbi:MAG: ribosome small subunit-dependent GTPase A [Clostridia bacterium]|nr:ribosome small subunit-dependent GTPase A [Clostridia bacterium]